MKKINILIIISLLFIFGSNIRPVLGHEPSENQQSSHRESLGPEHVWKASTNVWGDLYSKCLDSNGPDNSPALIHCVSTFMKAKGATAKAISFMKLMDGEAYLTSFKDTGRVDIGRLYYIFRVNDNSALAFLNGKERVLDVDLICCAEG